jgi:hypothetical protein
MTEQEKLAAYQARSPDHALSSAIGYLTTALMYAVRADTDLHWLSGADSYLTHAEKQIAEFRTFVAALKDGDPCTTEMVAKHKAVVAEACAIAAKEFA